jgi:hypothetical protein
MTITRAGSLFDQHCKQVYSPLAFTYPSPGESPDGHKEVQKDD